MYMHKYVHINMSKIKTDMYKDASLCHVICVRMTTLRHTYARHQIDVKAVFIAR